MPRHSSKDSSEELFFVPLLSLRGAMNVGSHTAGKLRSWQGAALHYPALPCTMADSESFCLKTLFLFSFKSWKLKYAQLAFILTTANL